MNRHVTAGHERFTFSLIADVFAVLDAHGYQRGDNGHVGRAAGLLIDLTDAYEGQNQRTCPGTDAFDAQLPSTTPDQHHRR